MGRVMLTGGGQTGPIAGTPCAEEARLACGGRALMVDAGACGVLDGWEAVNEKDDRA